MHRTAARVRLLFQQVEKFCNIACQTFVILMGKELTYLQLVPSGGKIKQTNLICVCWYNFLHLSLILLPFEKKNKHKLSSFIFILIVNMIL